MTQLHKGMIRFALVRLAGLVATVAIIAAILGAILGGAPLTAIADFGSTSSESTVAALIAERLAVTLPLALMSLLLALLVGVPLGAFAARRGGIVARAIGTLADGTLAVPAVFAGMVLVIVFAGLLHWLPQGGFVVWAQNFAAAFASLLLPATALAVPLGALVLRVALRSFADLAHLPAVNAGRFTGLTLAQALWRHGYPSALLPIVGLVGRSFGLVVAGAMIVENVFYLPGLGRLVFTAVTEQDLPVVRAGLLVLIALSALARFVADVTIAISDPRRLAESPT